jgi:hypothetical protein
MCYFNFGFSSSPALTFLSKCDFASVTNYDGFFSLSGQGVRGRSLTDILLGDSFWLVFTVDWLGIVFIW